MRYNVLPMATKFHFYWISVLLSLFPCLLQAQEAKEKFTTVSELENFFKIKNDVLINFQGEAFPRIAFTDALHEDLAYLLKDPEQTIVIHQAYLRHVRPHLPEELIAPFSRSLAKVCFLFGAEHFSPENALLLALREEGQTTIDWV